MQDETPNLKTYPNHVAIIMDGNGRWAKEKSLSRIAGHHEGVKSVQAVLRAAKKVGIKFITIYAFSTENWNRPKIEVEGLMSLLIDALTKYEKELHLNKIKLKIIGNTEDLPKKVQKIINRITVNTSNYSDSNLILALNYGGRREITDTMKKIAKKIKDEELSIESINEKIISENLYDPSIPYPDLMIRTSGEIRLSNFMLWQLAYSEIYITNKYWPDFREKEFFNALIEYESRNRRFGKLS